MPPRFKYWTILIEGTPTAFRAATAEELLPTLRQLQRRQAGARLRWFDGQQYWSSPAEALQAARAARTARLARTARRAPDRRHPGSARQASRRPDRNRRRR